MARYELGRFTDGHDGEVVVFLIGMRVNRWRSLRSWWPPFMAMPRMLRELSQDPDSGLLGHRLLIGAGGPLVVQYWSSVEALLAYAQDRGAEHRPAWRRFNERARRSAGAVGIWHETYLVRSWGARDDVRRPAGQRPRRGNLTGAGRHARRLGAGAAGPRRRLTRADAQPGAPPWQVAQERPPAQVHAACGSRVASAAAYHWRRPVASRPLRSRLAMTCMGSSTWRKKSW